MLEPMFPSLWLAVCPPSDTTSAQQEILLAGDRALDADSAELRVGLSWCLPSSAQSRVLHISPFSRAQPDNLFFNVARLHIGGIHTTVFRQESLRLDLSRVSDTPTSVSSVVSGSRVACTSPRGAGDAHLTIPGSQPLTACIGNAYLFRRFSVTRRWSML